MDPARRDIPHHVAVDHRADPRVFLGGGGHDRGELPYSADRGIHPAPDSGGCVEYRQQHREEVRCVGRWRAVRGAQRCLCGVPIFDGRSFGGEVARWDMPVAGDGGGTDN